MQLNGEVAQLLTTKTTLISTNISEHGTKRLEWKEPNSNLETAQEPSIPRSTTPTSKSLTVALLKMENLTLFKGKHTAISIQQLPAMSDLALSSHGEHTTSSRPITTHIQLSTPARIGTSSVSSTRGFFQEVSVMRLKAVSSSIL